MGRISILMYHQVGDFPPMRRHRANYCQHRRFAAQMGFLKRFRYAVLSLDEALACLSGAKATPDRAVVLTFDDGYEGFLRYALPVLQRHGFPAIVYLISGYLGRFADWFAKDPGRPIPRLMNAAQVRQLSAAGVTVGSHTATHVKLGEVGPAVQRAELADSKAALEDLLGGPVRHLCYPFGSFDRSAVAAAREAGYRSAVTCLKGPAEPLDHPLLLPRKGISYGDNLLGYAWKVAVKNRPKPDLVAWRDMRADLETPPVAVRG